MSVLCVCVTAPDRATGETKRRSGRVGTLHAPAAFCSSRVRAPYRSEHTARYVRDIGETQKAKAHTPVFSSFIHLRSIVSDDLYSITKSPLCVRRKSRRRGPHVPPGDSEAASPCVRPHAHSSSPHLGVGLWRHLPTQLHFARTQAALQLSAVQTAPNHNEPAGAWLVRWPLAAGGAFEDHVDRCAGGGGAAEDPRPSGRVVVR